MFRARTKKEKDEEEGEDDDEEEVEKVGVDDGKREKVRIEGSLLMNQETYKMSQKSHKNLTKLQKVTHLTWCFFNILKCGPTATLLKTK